MKQVISRIAQVRGIQSLHLATTPRATTTALAARTISTTATRSSETTEWLRRKLWKDGKAPGPADPYAPRIDREYGMVEAVAPRATGDDADGTNDMDAHGREQLELKLPLPPPRRREAATDKDIAETHPAYEPATSLDGLAEVPVLETWWEQPGNWSAADTFRGFGSVEKVTDKAAVQVYLRRALVEALALRQAGVLGEWAVRRWEEGSRADMDAALAVDIVVGGGAGGGGEPVLEGNVAAVVDNLMREPLPEEEKEMEEDEADIASSPPPPPPPPPARISGSEAVEITKAWNAAWLNITVDEEMKFALRKRLYQLTGNLIPDAKLGAARTIRHLIALVAKKPKPQKLAEILNNNSSIAELANVKVHERRVGPIDKEIAVGRWKIIEEELRKRNLPLVMGSNKTASREKKYIKGKI